MLLKFHFFKAPSAPGVEPYCISDPAPVECASLDVGRQLAIDTAASPEMDAASILIECDAEKISERWIRMADGWNLASES